MGRNRKKQLLEPHVLRYVEGELTTHLARKKHIEWLLDCIAWERPGWAAGPDPNVGGGRSGGRIADLTLGRAIILERELDGIRGRVSRLNAALELLSAAEQKVVTLLYLEHRYTAPGAAIHMGYTPAHIYRLKDRALLQIAVALGVADPLLIGHLPVPRMKDEKKAASTTSILQL